MGIDLISNAYKSSFVDTKIAAHHRRIILQLPQVLVFQITVPETQELL